MSLLSTADVIFICTPLALIIPKFEELIAYLSPSTIVTDVGSVKAPIVKALSPMWDNFIGGHPMAGSTDNGIEARESNLFVNKPYVLTPISTTPSYAIEVVEKIVRSLNANIYHCQPEQHDRAVSWISHLPVMVSGSLIAACMSETDLEVLELAKKFASSGFKDTSRVGGGNPELGLMMARYNRQALLNSLQQYRHKIDELINLIDQEDWTALEENLNLNHKARPDFIE
jgi:arogenate dehydrogenase (NADP+)